MKRILRVGALTLVAATLLTVAQPPRADAAAGSDALFASLMPLENLDAITGKIGISDIATVNSAVSAVTLGNADVTRASSISTAAFSTGGVQASFSGLGGANAIAINTGIASSQTQSVNVNLVIGAGGTPIRIR